jgi:hypothetical protein
MFSFITLPTSAPTDLFATIGTIFSDLWVLISFAVGIPLAFYLIQTIIGLVAVGKEGYYYEKLSDEEKEEYWKTTYGNE